MKRFRSLIVILIATFLAAPALGAYVPPDPGGREGWVIDTSTGNIVAMRAGTAVMTISTAGALTVTDLTTSDDLVVTDDLTVTGLATVGETLGVTGATTLTGGVSVNGAASAMSFPDGDEQITVKDNDTTALIIGSTGRTNLLTIDSGNDTETVVITGTTTADALHVDTGTAQFDENVDVTGGVDITGALTVSTTGSFTGNVDMSGSLTVVSQTIGLDMTQWRIYDNPDAFLDQSPGDDDDLSLIMGTIGTHATRVTGMDCGGLADTPQYAVFWFVIPSTYKAGSTVSIVANVGMQATVADQAATLDFNCYVPDYANADATVSGDLITPAAQSVNFTTFADYTFAIDDDASGYELDAGTVVQCKITALCDDDGNGGDNITIVINRIDVVIST